MLPDPQLTLSISRRFKGLEVFFSALNFMFSSSAISVGDRSLVPKYINVFNLSCRDQKVNFRGYSKLTSLSGCDPKRPGIEMFHDSF